MKTFRKGKMDQHIIYLVMIAVLLVLSFFFSGAEIAFVTANRLKVEIKLRQNKPDAKLASDFIHKPEDFLTTTLVGNNFVNVMYSTLMTVYLSEVMGIENIFVKAVISSVIILIVGEVIPKSIFREFADHLIFLIAFPLRLFHIILFPLISFTSSIATFLVKLLGVSSVNVAAFFHRHDIQLLLKEGEKTGSLAPEESEIIENVFELKEIKVRECMIPRTDISAVDINSEIQDCLQSFIESGFSKLPVYEESIDNVVGIVYAHDLFKSPASLNEIMREVMFVPESKRANDLLKEFRSSKTSVAIVVDEFGGTSGLITMEDLIEELVGDIKDEFDTEDHYLKQIDEKTYLLSGRIQVEDLNEKYHLGIEEGDFDTIGGFIIDHVGRIPMSGEKLEIGHFEITIIKATKIKIDLVKLIIRTGENG